MSSMIRISVPHPFPPQRRDQVRHILLISQPKPFRLPGKCGLCLSQRVYGGVHHDDPSLLLNEQDLVSLLYAELSPNIDGNRDLSL